MKMTNPKKLTKCPVCGGRLILEDLYQYSINHYIGSSGKIINKGKHKKDIGPMEVSAIYCENNDFATDYEYYVTIPEHTNASVVEDEGIFYLCGDIESD